MNEPQEWVAAPQCVGPGLAGRIQVPPSKSLTQRAIVAAALAGDGSCVRRPLDAEDPRLLAAALEGAGFGVRWSSDRVTVGRREVVNEGSFNLGNNGTGARFLLAVLAAWPGRWLLDGSPRLRERPVAALVNALRELGAEIESPAAGRSVARDERLPLRLLGRALEGGAVHLDATASSQFVSALMLLGAVLPRGLDVAVAARPPSRPYLDLTAEVLTAFGAKVQWDEDALHVSVRGRLHPAEVEVEGDWSAAAFPLAGVAAGGGEVEVVGVRRESRQGDAAILQLLVGAGCRQHWTRQGVVVRGPVRTGVCANLADTPDLFPPLAVVVARHGGVLSGLAGLAVKESDRLAVMTRHLRTLGFSVADGPGTFASEGGRPLPTYTGAPLSPFEDHRIAMALAVASRLVPGVRVSDPGCVAKSWPQFWAAWQRLGEVA